MIPWLAVAFAGTLPDLLIPTPPGPASDDAAVVIGLQRYGFLPEVPYAHRDAEAVGAWMRSAAGMDPDRVRIHREGHREAILAAVDAAAAEVGPGGRLWIWFSGHGATSPTDGSPMLVGDDAKPQPDSFTERSVSVAELSQRLSVPTLLVFDACAAGRSRDGTDLLPGTRFAVPSWALSGSITVWSAAGPGQLAEPWPAVEHGLFTALALGALRGWADGSIDGAVDGQVTLPEAHAWVVRAMVAVGAPQQPDLAGDAALAVVAREGSPPLSALPPLRLSRSDPEDEEGTPLPTAPLVYRGSGMFEGADGLAISRRQLLTSLSDHPEVVRIGRREGRSLGLMGVGGVGVAVGGLGTLYAAAYHPVYRAQRALGGDDAASLGLFVLPWVSTAVVGTATLILGETGRQRNQRRLAAAASDALP